MKILYRSGRIANQTCPNKAEGRYGQQRTPQLLKSISQEWRSVPGRRNSVKEHVQGHKGEGLKKKKKTKQVERLTVLGIRLWK